jgi:hypothetical protein
MKPTILLIQVPIKRRDLAGGNAEINAYVRSPSAVIEPFSEVAWWYLAAVPLAPRYPWSLREVEALRAIGVCLPPLKQVLELRARGWQVMGRSSEMGFPCINR